MYLLWLLLLFSDLAADNYGIPRKIWQTYRTKDLPKPAAEARASWLELNPHYEYHFFDDAEIERYVTDHCSADMQAFFQSLPLGVMKADLWRYLVIADQGGVYTDIDSVCCLPIDYWTALLGPLNQVEADRPLLFIALEDEVGLCQWTFMATPKHPAMAFVCEYMLENWRKKGIDLSVRNFVHMTTGPTIWKLAIMAYLGAPIATRMTVLRDQYQSDKKYRKRINDLGIYFLSDRFYSGFASLHLNGSTQFKEGYISWREEGHLYRRKNANL
jgi:hypothetical protein